MKRGLSSSAAVCVLVVRAFEYACALHMSTAAVMELAYSGEMLTPSKCGRMDQCVAMGAGKIAHMTFRGTAVTLRGLAVGAPLHFVVASLKASKNTVRILASLSAGFPFPHTQQQAAFVEYPTSLQLLVVDAVEAVQHGSSRGLAGAMTSAQAEFDRLATPLVQSPPLSHPSPVLHLPNIHSSIILILVLMSAPTYHHQCPEELTSPRLHAVMEDAVLRDIALAIKGVGSQGDGSVQVLCGTADTQRLALARLVELGCEPFLLTIPAST
jgi:hypothetical protein